MTEESSTTWMCTPCGYVYDEALGLPEAGIAPGTPLHALPANWVCPDCGVGVQDFVALSESAW